MPQVVLVRYHLRHTYDMPQVVLARYTLTHTTDMLQVILPRYHLRYIADMPQVVRVRYRLRHTEASETLTTRSQRTLQRPLTHNPGTVAGWAEGH